MSETRAKDCPFGRPLCAESYSIYLIVVATAREQLTQAGLESRCEIVGGDFFTAVPPDGDAYLLRMCFTTGMTSAV